MILPTLSIKQPWTMAITRLGKDVENRTWKTAYRGPMALHASTTWAEEAEYSHVLQSAWRESDAESPLAKGSPGVVFGAVVAVAELTGICGGQLDDDTFIGDKDAELEFCECSAWAMPGQYHWRFADVRLLRDPVPCRGALKVWGLPKGVNDAVQAQL